MKSSYQCPKCGSRDVATLVDQAQPGADQAQPGARGRGTQRCTRCQVIHPLSAVTCDCGQPLPLLRASDHIRERRYFCATCGYTERYIASAEAIPWDRLEGLRWLNSKADQGPYR